MKKIKDSIELAAEVMASKNVYDVINEQSSQIATLAIGMKSYANGTDKDGTMIKGCIGDAYLAMMGLLLWFEVDPDELFKELIEKHKDVLQ